MKTPVPVKKELYYRLIAIWVLCESVLGGMIHGLKLPVSGLIVGSSAVICICLIAYYVPVKGAILRATILVAVFKLMLSPHTPLPAYFAVFFQGLAGELIFINRKNYKLSCMILAIVALLESATQRLLIMTFIYGNSFWDALNKVTNSLTNSSGVNYSFYFMAYYLLLHLIVGILIGWFAGGLPNRSAGWNVVHTDFIITGADKNQTVFPSPGVQTNKKKMAGKVLFIIWIILILLFLQSYFKIGNPLLPAHMSFQILLRSIIILLAWYFVISPLLSKYLKQWLLKKKIQSSGDLNAILQLLPSMKYILTRSWELTSSFKGFTRLAQFCKIVCVNTLHG